MHPLRAAPRAAPRWCSAWATRRRPDVRRRGPGRRGGPQGLPFVGRSGQLLDRLVLEEIGLDARPRATSPTSSSAGRRATAIRSPTRSRRAGPWLEQQLELIDPKVVVTLGNFATKLLLDTNDGITKLRGRQLPVPRRRARAHVPPRRRAARRRRADGPDAGRPRAGQAGAAPASDGVAVIRLPHEVGRRHPRARRRARRAGAARRPDPAGRRPRRRQDRVRPGLRPRRSASTEPITSPTFTLVRQYDGPAAAAPPRRLPARAAAGGRSTSGSPSCSTRRR